MAIDWGRLRRVADCQRDLLTRRQCLEAGLTDAAIQWRVSSKRWVRLHPGVFLTRPGRQDWEVGATAVLLNTLSGAPEADAALGGRSAAYLWGLERRPPSRLELVIPYGRSVRGPVHPGGLRIRRSMRWADLVDDREFPWRTTRAATVLDVAGDGSTTDALSVVARAVQKDLVAVAELRQELALRPGHRYGRVLRPALGDVEDGGESGAELLYIRDVERAHGLPTATRQSPSDRGRRRFHDHEYEEWGLIVEVDGRLGHEQWSDPSATASATGSCSGTLARRLACSGSTSPCTRATPPSISPRS